LASGLAQGTGFKPEAVRFISKPAKADLLVPPLTSLTALPKNTELHLIMHARGVRRVFLKKLIKNAGCDLF